MSKTPDRTGTDPESPPFRFRLEKAAFRVGTRRILPGTDWTIRPGEQWLVWGPNGAGKTTLAGAVAGEVPVVEGRRRFGGGGKRPVVANVSFDETVRLSAREDERDLARDFAGRPGDQLTAGQAVDGPDAEAALGLAGMRHLVDRPVRSLSSGEARKLLIARALARRPELLILDEPFDGLDHEARRHLARVVEGIMADGVQVVLITHRTAEILPGITHVIELSDGRVAYAGPLDGWPRPPEPGHRRPGGSHGSGGAPGEPLLRLEGVRVAYGPRTVFDGLDWVVRRGERWAVAGPNGAGKTTLIRLVSGDHPQAYANRIFLFGRRRGSGESVWEIKGRIGLVSPELQIRYRRRMSGIDVAVSGFFDSVGLYRMATPDQRAAAGKWFDRLGIVHLAEERFDRMSTGQRRMILLARAMVKRPELLILDEPCQSLDAANRHRVLEIVDRMAPGLEALVFVTHHPDELPRCITHTLTLPVS